MLAVSVISTMNVLWPRLSSSVAPTRAKRRSTTPIRAASAGTKLPIWARIAIRATWRMYVLLPAMFGPVISRIVPPSGPSRDVVGHELARRQQSRRAPGAGRPRSRSTGSVDHLGPAVALRARPARPAPPGRRAGPAPRRPGSAGAPRPRPGRAGSTNSSYSSSQARSSAREDLVLVLLQLGRDVALGVLDASACGCSRPGPSRRGRCVISM